MKKEILNANKTRLRLFESGIKMDESLPKHKEYNDYVAKKKLLNEAKLKGMSASEMAQADIDLLEMEQQGRNLASLPPILTSNGVGMDDSVIPRKGIPDYEKLKKMFLEDTGLDSCKVVVTAYMKDIMEKNRWSFGNTITPASDQSIIIDGGKKDSFWDRLRNLVHPDEHPTPTSKPIIEFDVVAFFNRVKLETEDSQQSYVNRLRELVECIGYCDVTGQVALKETLFEQLTVNKYESILWASGMYKAVSEEKIVEFAQESQRGLSLDYMSNFSRVIPVDIVKKKIEADKLGVFDNYVILHYDPEAKSYIQTEEEKRKEIERKKDPILFGVIMGSNKLYYIGDWIDEYCDLTFDVLTEKLGQEIIEQDFIKEHIKL